LSTQPDGESDRLSPPLRWVALVGGCIVGAISALALGGALQGLRAAGRLDTWLVAVGGLLLALAIGLVTSAIVGRVPGWLRWLSVEFSRWGSV
jgi:hypothetical protein